MQHVPVLGQSAACDPEEINHHLRRVGPAADAAMDGDQIALGDDEA
ncbi:hypothetical protein [Hansschlegelia sp. KR7-227]